MKSSSGSEEEGEEEEEETLEEERRRQQAVLQKEKVRKVLVLTSEINPFYTQNQGVIIVFECKGLKYSFPTFSQCQSTRRPYNFFHCG